MFLSFAFGLIGFGCLFIWQYGNPDNPKKYLKRGGVLFGQVFLTWIIGFGVLWLIQSRAKDELRSIIANEQVNLSIDGEHLDNRKKVEITQILKTLKSISAHHSHPTKEIIIELEYNNQKSKIYLNKDSERENEYWVFWDKYRITESNEIGRITSKKLKKYGS